MKRSINATIRIYTRGSITPEFERKHSRNVSRESQRLQVEHQLHVFIERVRHPSRSRRKLSLLPTSITRFYTLYTPFDLTNVLKITFQTVPICCFQIPLKVGNLTNNPVPASRQTKSKTSCGRRTCGAMLRECRSDRLAPSIQRVRMLGYHVP